MHALTRRAFAKLPLALALPVGLLAASRARADETPGVTATEIKIGNTDAYSGPASAYGGVFQDGQRPGRHRRAQDKFHFIR
jgi:hypothetical protein